MSLKPLLNVNKLTIKILYRKVLEVTTMSKQPCHPVSHLPAYPLLLGHVLNLSEHCLRI